MIIRKADNPYIVFDLDDTLFQEFDYLRSAYKEIAMIVSPGDPRNVYELMLGKYLEGTNVFGWLMDKFGSVSSELTLERLLKTYREHYPEISLSEDVHDFITRLQNAGVPFGLITDGRSTTQRNKLKALGILDMFDDLVISEEFGTEKPNPANYRHYIDKHPGHCYFYVGDNTGKDFIVPSSLGWTSICVKDRGLNIHRQDLSRSPVPDYIINTFKEIEIA